MKRLVFITGSITFADLEEGRVAPLDVHEQQVKNWLLRPAQSLAESQPKGLERYESGMALFALELMFFEPHGQYLLGVDSNGRAGKTFDAAFERFRDFLIDRGRVGAGFDERAAKKVRDWARNGLFHSGQIKDGLLVDIRRFQKATFYRNPVWSGWLVDPWELLEDLKEYFASYLSLLKNPEHPEHEQLSKNFSATFDRLVVPPAAAT